MDKRRMPAPPLTDDIELTDVALLLANIADLRAENDRLGIELQARRREVATLHSMMSQVLRGPWVYVDDDQPPRWA